tara:strand:- start:175 stop:546 length:372 start_codon:yes stop_codon:yes gene_type:complete
MKYKKISKNFGKFLFGGIIWTILSIFLAWFLIDYRGMLAAIASSIIVIVGIVLRFYFYTGIGLIKKQFLKFASANILFSVLIIVFMTLSIDIMKIPTLIATPIIIGGLFIFKFLFFIKVRLIS